MPKTIPFHIEVEEIATGSFMRKLHEMPGIVKMTCMLGHGGEGDGRKELEHHAAEKSNGPTAEQATLKLLMSGPKHIREISAALGGGKSRAYGATYLLRKQGLAEAGAGKGMHQLTAKARSQFDGALPALPAPASVVTHGPAGRAPRGSGNVVLKAILTEGPKSPAELRSSAAAHGISPKSITGVLDRAKKTGLIKKNGSGYELTAKGQKIEMNGAASHG